MPEVIKTIDELTKFLNDKGVLEIALRGKNQKFKQFQKVILQNSSQSQMKEQIEKAMNILNKNTQLGEQTLHMVGNVAKLGQLNALLSVLNLGATCAGFAIVCQKLTGMSTQINEVLEKVKSSTEMFIKKEYRSVVLDHKDMLNSRKLKNQYSEEEMRKLVDRESTILNLLIDAFDESLAGDKETFILLIFSLASMLANSIVYFDETYYFNHRDILKNEKTWHPSHEDWSEALSRLTSSQFLREIQDHGFLDLGLNTCENDQYYKGLCAQVVEFENNIRDNQDLLVVFENEMLFNEYINLTNQEIKETIFQAFVEADIPFESQELAESLQSTFDDIAIA